MSSKSLPIMSLPAGTRIEGDLITDGDAVISGQVAGSIRVGGRLELEKSARVGGDVAANTLRVSGHIEGDTLCRGMTRLEAGGVLGGALTTARLEIGEGASFDGRLKLTPDAELVDDESDQAGSFSAGNRGILDPVPGTVNAGLRRRRRRAGAFATPA